MDGDQDNDGDENTVNVSKLLRTNLQWVVALNIYTKAARAKTQANNPTNILFSGTSGPASLPLHISSLLNSTIAP